MNAAPTAYKQVIEGSYTIPLLSLCGESEKFGAKPAKEKIVSNLVEVGESAVYRDEKKHSPYIQKSPDWATITFTLLHQRRE